MSETSGTFINMKRKAKFVSRQLNIRIIYLRKIKFSLFCKKIRIRNIRSGEDETF